jgi:hypothetical protein
MLAAFPPFTPVALMLLLVFAAPVSALAARVQRGSELNAWEGTCETRERCRDWASLTSSRSGRRLEPPAIPLPMEGRHG